jgi:hypothetical protein
MRRVIGSVQPDERIGYVLPDAVSGDQNNVESRLSEEIRAALGGVAELGFQAGATALEFKTLYGRAAATAATKANAIYTFGLCKLFELAIAFEEHLFMKSFEQVVGWDSLTNGPLSKEQIRTFVLGNPEQEIEGQGVPEGVIGILPQATGIEVSWRWRGPVFEDTPQDQQLKSIVMRNLVEEGISTLPALQTIYPDRTEKELNSMLGGVPFRRGTKILGMVQQTAGVYGQLLAIPSVSVPGMPLGALLGQQFENSIAQLLEKLSEELNRGEPNELATKSIESIVRAFGGGPTAADAWQLASQPPDGGSDLSGEPADAGADAAEQQPAKSWLLSNTGTTGYAASDGSGFSRPESGRAQRDWVSYNAERAASQYGPAAIGPATAAGVYAGAPFDGLTNAVGLPGSPSGLSAVQPQSATAGPYGGSNAAGAGTGLSQPTDRAFDQSAQYPGAGNQPLRPEFIRPIPVPGATVHRSTIDADRLPNQLPATSGRPGSPDIQPPGVPWRTLFPTAAGILDRITGNTQDPRSRKR